jgi:hypothetical protein
MMAIRRTLLALSIVTAAALAAFAGCAGGGVCFRNSDCESGYACLSGTCAIPPPPSPSDAGDAGDASDAATPSPIDVDAGDASDASQITDAG